jgi:hypothetical protein
MLLTLDHALLEQVATLRREHAALRAENTVLQQRIRELEVQLGQSSSHSARPPSSDPPHVPPKQREAPSGRKRGGQPGHRAALRALLPVEQVDGRVAVVSPRCRRCRQPFSESAGRGRGRVGRHQVMELLPLAVRVTEYRMAVRRCAAGGTRTRGDLPAGVSRRPFGLRLTAVIAPLSSRCRLSRREVRQLLPESTAGPGVAGRGGARGAGPECRAPCGTAAILTARMTRVGKARRCSCPKYRSDPTIPANSEPSSACTSAPPRRWPIRNAGVPPLTDAARRRPDGGRRFR